MIKVDIRKKIKVYNGVSSINVKASFHTGQVTLISGPSGAGKTTFLKILAGLIKAEEGVVSVDGEVWLDTSQKIFLPTQKTAIRVRFSRLCTFSKHDGFRGFAFWYQRPGLHKTIVKYG